MRTFLEYLDIKDFETTCNAYLSQVIIEAENNEALAELLGEGFWDTVGNIGKGIGKFAQGVWSGGGIKPGFQAGVSQVVGPASQYQSAIGALQKALAGIQKDPQWMKSMTTGSSTLPAMPLPQWLSDTVKELQSQVTQFQNRQLQTGQNANTTAAVPQPGAATSGGPKTY